MKGPEEKTHFLEDHEPLTEGAGDYIKAQSHHTVSADTPSGLQKLQEEQNAPRNKCRFSENERVRNVVAFWILGLLNNYGYVVMLSAAKDIDKNMAGLVLLADIIPTVLIKVRPLCACVVRRLRRRSSNILINTGDCTILGTLLELSITHHAVWIKQNSVLLSGRHHPRFGTKTTWSCISVNRSGYDFLLLNAHDEQSYSK